MDRKNDEWLIAKDLEGISRVLIELLSTNFPVERRKPRKSPVLTISTEIQTKYIPNASPERYRPVNSFGAVVILLPLATN
jgi:hypothetical protein